MKIQIDNQIRDIDEETFLLWLRVGSIPSGTYILSERLTSGEWRQIHELDWSNEQSWTRGADESQPFRREFEKEKRFLSYQRRIPVVTLVLIALNTIAFILLDQFVGRSQDVANLIRFGAYSYTLIVQNGEYWRLITNAFLHIGSFHFFLNMGILFILGNLLEGLYGRSRYIILYLVSAIGGSLASLIFVRAAIGAGASGAIFGLMGVVVALGLRHKERLPLRRGRVFGMRLLPFIALDVALGFIIPHINISAHVGGLAVGFGAGIDFTASHIRRWRARKLRRESDRGAMHRIDCSERCRDNTAFLSSFRHCRSIREYGILPIFRQNFRSTSSDLKSDCATEITHGNRTACSNNCIGKRCAPIPRMPPCTRKSESSMSEPSLRIPASRIGTTGSWGLYEVGISGKESEKDELENYVKLYEKIIRKSGYHQMLYRTLEYFYTRGKSLNPDRTFDWDAKLEKLYRAAIAADSEYANWHNNLAWLYVEQRVNAGQAVELAQQAVKRDANNSTLLDTLAWAYLHNGQFRKSLRIFEQVLSNRSDNEEIKYARESSWKGVNEWVETGVSPSKSEERLQAFDKFYAYMSRQFIDRPAEQAKLDVAFNRFRANYH